MIGQLVRDANGFPVIKDGRPQVEKMTVADYVFRHKILERLGDIETWAQQLNVSADGLRAELKDVQGITGLLPDKTIIENGLYRESSVIAARNRLALRVIAEDATDTKM